MWPTNGLRLRLSPRRVMRIASTPWDSALSRISPGTSVDRAYLGVHAYVERRPGLVGRDDQVDGRAPLAGHLRKGRRRNDVQDPDIAVGVEEHGREPDEGLDLGRLLDRDEDLSVHRYFPINGSRSRSSWRTSTYATPR